MAAWVASLDPAGIGLIAFEPTGGLERPLRRALAAAHLPFTRVHPNQVVALRTSRGIKAKTDAIDAQLLADPRVRPAPAPGACFAARELRGRGLAPLVEGDDELHEMLARRRQLIDTLHAERCRCSRSETALVRRSIETVITAAR